MSETKGDGVVGWCDGIRGDTIYGWAWRPSDPNASLEIEVLVDGSIAGVAPASDYRPDLRANGVGHGRYGWSLELALDPDRKAPYGILARVVDGGILTDGEFEHVVNPPLSDFEKPEFQAFLDSVTPTDRTGDGPTSANARPIVNFLLHCPEPMGDEPVEEPEGSYGIVMNAFRPALEQLGRVHTIDDLSIDPDRLHAEQIARGEGCMLLSFAPPHRTPLDLRCPVIPVVAWGYPNLPDHAWRGEARHDWRFVLRQTGRAIVLSQYAERAVRAAMGPDFPVAAIPAPMWDRPAEALDRRPPSSGGAIEIHGFVFDTRGKRFSAAEAAPPPPRLSPCDTWAASGVIFTTVFSPNDHQKNWVDALTAFIEAHRQDGDATMVLRMIAPDTSVWWWEFCDALQRQQTFDCRIVVLHGDMDDVNQARLVEASHWVVNSSLAEGLSLPLLEFMSAGRPAIAPSHTAMSDFISASNAILVESDEECCSWPGDREGALNTTRHRIDWPSLVAAFEEAYRVATVDPARYAAMAEAAMATMKGFCSDDAVAARLDAFLSLGQGRAQPAANPSPLMRAVAE